MATQLFTRNQLIKGRALGIALILGATPFLSTAQEPGPHPATHSSVQAQCVSIEQLSRQLRQRQSRVAEFRILREAAQELGLRIWLFGGTAAGYAHYVKWDLQRESGDHRFVASRFDYDFTNIYRSTQDADLVVDGDLQDAKRLETLIREKLSHLQGAKQDWEVRLLRRDRGEKQALLHNPDFLNQHTDSNSTGMIELTDPPLGESTVRDLRDWDDVKNPQFLRDVAQGKLHFYFSPTHSQTTRFQKGLNPPIFSVIRYFTKAFQYGLEMRPEDAEVIAALIREFKPKSDLAEPDAARRFEAIGSRLIMHASDVEFAWNTLESIGLRRKLIAASKPKETGSLGWWLNREPLRTRPVGEGKGKTLRQILKSRKLNPEEAVFAHETMEFTAWESIIRDATGRPNVLISRAGFPGEAAAHGDGHYTQLGRFGARGTGLTVRYRADLNAREGTDFTFEDDYFVWLNRAALHVIPESLNISWVEYFEMLSSGRRFDTSDRGILEKLKKRMAQHPPTDEDIRKIRSLVHAEIGKGAADPTKWNENFLLEWFQSPQAAQFREDWLDLLAATRNPPPTQMYALPTPLHNFLVSHPLLQDPAFLAEMVDRGDPNLHRFFILHLLPSVSSDGLSPQREKILHDFVLAELEKPDRDFDIHHHGVFLNWFGNPRSGNYPEDFVFLSKNEPLDDRSYFSGFVIDRHPVLQDFAFQTELIDRGDEMQLRFAVRHFLLNLAPGVLTPERERKLLEVVRTEIRKGGSNPPAWQPQLVDTWFRSPLSEKYPGELLALVESTGFDLPSHLEQVLVNHALMKDPSFQKAVIDRNQPHFDRFAIHYFFVWLDQEGKQRLFRTLLDRGHDQLLAQRILPWHFIPEDLIQAIIDRGNADFEIAEHVLNSGKWNHRKDWFERLLQRGTVDESLAGAVKNGYFEHPVFALVLAQRGHFTVELAYLLEERPIWTDHPELIEALVMNPRNTRHLVDERILAQPRWRKQPQLLAACGGKDPTYDLLKEAFSRGLTFMPAENSKDCNSLLKNE